MSSSLFGKSQQQGQRSDLISAVNEVKRQIGNQDPAAVLRQLCQQDPQVRSFVQSVQGMDPMQLAFKFFGNK